MDASRRRRNWPVRVCGAMVAVALSLPPDARGQDQEQRPAAPFDSEVVERSGVTLMLLDVVVTDENGDPLPGLTEQDFLVQLNGRVQPIYSLDDLCPRLTKTVETQADDAAAAHPAEPVIEARPERTPPTVAAEELRFVAYLDYSQLTQYGRANANRSGQLVERQVTTAHHARPSHLSADQGCMGTGAPQSREHPGRRLHTADIVGTCLLAN